MANINWLTVALLFVSNLFMLYAWYGHLKSEKGGGTTLVCTFKADNIDLPPMGDLVSTVISLFNFAGDFDLVFTHVKGDNEYSISRLELKDAVGGFDSVEGLSLAKEFLEGQEESL